ncbi:MAG: TIGR02444 family protein [Nannocystaceae bacterium]|nr:TIGR02444 family protein [bacterium]
MDPDFHVCPLWTFSLAHYSKSGVKDACLRLQDEFGLDVNVALACLWHERRGATPLSRGELAALLDAVAEPRARVQRIRPLRREAKSVDDALYRALKRSELLAENLLQLALCQALSDRPGAPKGDGRASLEGYAEQLAVTLPEALIDAFLA